VEVFGIGYRAVWASGWAVDPDANAGVTVAVSARLISDINDPMVVLEGASVWRDDVAAATGLSVPSGFSATVPVSEAGTYEVCVVARNIGVGRDQLLACKNVVLDDHRPIGSLDSVHPTASGVTVAGWSYD